MKELEQIENIIESLNQNLQPISNEINENLNFLTQFLDIENTYDFKQITMDEITEDQ